MRKLLFIGLLLIRLPAGAVEKGAARAAVLAELGQPDGSMQSGGKEILLFKTGTVTLQNGIVTETDLSQKYAQEAEELAQKAKEIRAAEQAEQEKQKQLYPEDHIVQMRCAYSKTEDWSSLPEFIRPAKGTHQYDIYIPQGYHESDIRRWKCLLLESPALWNSVKERARSEKWIVIILHAAAGQETGRTMNTGFLAAFDDAVERFRIDKERIFIAGRVPSAVFATMRPVAGIILQEPDFQGLEKSAPGLNLTRQNPNLRAYVLLGNRDSNNVQTQVKYIVSRIPKYHIEIYKGSTALLPQPLADKALDWMKKEYALP
jgi:hypothetical protein